MKNRTVHAKLHVPFVPKAKKPVTKEKETLKKTPKLSEDTFYIPYLDLGTIDEQLREFFKEYDPEQIYIFTDKRKRHRFFKRGQTSSALVTLKSAKSLEEIKEELKNEEFNGKKLSIWPASNTKIKRVAKYVKTLAEKPEKAAVEKEVIEAAPIVDAPVEPTEAALNSVPVESNEVSN